EVAEGVVLMLPLAVLVPGLAHVCTAPDMGYRKDPAAVQQGQAGRGEPGIDAGARGPITGERERAGGGHGRGWARQTGGDAGAIGRDGPLPAHFVVVGAEGAFHRRLLEDLLAAAGKLQGANLRRAIERLVTQADARAAVLLTALHMEAVDRIGHFHPVAFTRCR